MAAVAAAAHGVYERRILGRIRFFFLIWRQVPLPLNHGFRRTYGRAHCVLGDRVGEAAEAEPSVGTTRDELDSPGAR